MCILKMQTQSSRKENVFAPKKHNWDKDFKTLVKFM